MFRTRLVSGIVLVALTFAVVLAGGWVLAAALCAISIIAYFELTKATGVHTEGKKANVLEMLGGFMIVLYYIVLHVSILEHLKYEDDTMVFSSMIAGIVIAFLAFIFCYVLRFPKFQSVQVMSAFFSFVYAPVLLSFLYIIREYWSHGFYLLWLVFLCSWGSDTCAYCVGVLFGKHKMAPKLSPKKSIEGAIGGVIGAALLFGLYTYYVINPFAEGLFRLHLGSAMCLGAIGALISMVGDLAASAVKRDHDIKDYGKLIPGHGGLMDRFDSVIIAAPFIYLGLSFIIEIL